MKLMQFSNVVRLNILSKYKFFIYDNTAENSNYWKIIKVLS